MQKGLSTKELALQIKEREHLIKKIENGELIPEELVRKKLEKALEIRLIDAPITEEEKKVQSKLTPTLGDLTTIKKVKK
jgi:putative transcription factor